MNIEMTERDFEEWRDEIHCGSFDEREGGEYESQYSAAALYDGGWRGEDVPEMAKLYGLSKPEAERLYNELLQIEQSNSKED